MLSKERSQKIYQKQLDYFETIYFMDDKTIIQKLLTEKDIKGFILLYDKYAPALYGSIIKITPDPSIANDILLKSFMKIIRKLNEFDARQCSLFIWMLRISIEQCGKNYKVDRNQVIMSLAQLNNKVEQVINTQIEANYR